MSNLGVQRRRRQPILVVLTLLGLLLGGLLSCPAVLDAALHPAASASVGDVGHDDDHVDGGQPSHCETDTEALETSDARSVERGASIPPLPASTAAPRLTPSTTDTLASPASSPTSARSGRVLLTDLVVSRT